jgi:hypothetical protein
MVEERDGTRIRFPLPLRPAMDAVSANEPLTEKQGLSRCIGPGVTHGLLDSARIYRHNQTSHSFRQLNSSARGASESPPPRRLP